MFCRYWSFLKPYRRLTPFLEMVNRLPFLGFKINTTDHRYSPICLFANCTPNWIQCHRSVFGIMCKLDYIILTILGCSGLNFVQSLPFITAWHFKNLMYVYETILIPLPYFLNASSHFLWISREVSTNFSSKIFFTGCIRRKKRNCFIFQYLHLFFFMLINMINVNLFILNTWKCFINFIWSQDTPKLWISVL